MYHITKAKTDGKYAILEIASLSGNGSLLYSQGKEAERFYVIDGEFFHFNIEIEITTTK